METKDIIVPDIEFSEVSVIFVMLEDNEVDDPDMLAVVAMVVVVSVSKLENS